MATLLTRKTGERLRQSLDATAASKPASQLTPMPREAPRSHKARIVMIGGALRLQVFLSGALWYDQAAVHASTANAEDGEGWYRVADAADGTVWSVLQTNGSTLVCYEASVPAGFRAKLPICIIVGGKIRQLADGVLSGGQLDAKSLNRTAAGKLQWSRYDSAASDADDFVPSSSHFGFRGLPVTGALGYITLLAALAKVDKPGWEGLVLLMEVIADAVEALKHSELKDIVDGLAGDDHGGTGNFSYLANSGSEERNSMGENTGLGDGLGGMSVDVNGRALSDGSFDAVNWLLRKLFDSAGVEIFDWENGRGLDGPATAFDWLLRTLGNGDWSALANFTIAMLGKMNELEVTQAYINVGGEGADNQFTKHEVLLPRASDGVMHRYEILGRDLGVYS